MFGVKVAPNLWQKFMDRTLQGINGVKCFFDDILVQGSDEFQLLYRLQKVLARLKENNLKVNKDKCNFFQKCINYLGHTIDKEGLHKNKEKVEAILKTERPKDVNELRFFLGLAHYYNKFISNLATITYPLNELLKKHKRFIWSDKCERSFKKIKQEITSNTTLVHFDPAKPITLATDASPFGLGAVLSHKFPDGSERPIAFASRTLTYSEKNYSQIDKEATAIYWALKKFYHYCYGRKFTLITDHKPLTSIFHPHKTLPAMSTMRLFHYAHFLSGFDYEIDYRRSSNHSNADFLSRFPVEKSPDNPKDQHSIFQIEHMNQLIINPEAIEKETLNDDELKKLLDALHTGKSVEPLGYRNNELTLQGNCILKGMRVMIPYSLQQSVLKELHTGHLGILKMKLLANSFVYWKNIDRDIETW
jgi:ribosome assembly protein YihI (activator of Der GTPase)